MMVHANSLRYQCLRALLSICNAHMLRMLGLIVVISMVPAHPAEACRLDAAHMRALQLDSTMLHTEFVILSSLVTPLMLAALATAMSYAERRRVLVSSRCRFLA